MASTLTFRLVTVAGAPSDPSTFKTVIPLGRPGDTIPLGRRTLRMLDIRDGDAAVAQMLLVVEDVLNERLAPVSEG